MLQRRYAMGNKTCKKENEPTWVKCTPYNFEVVCPWIFASIIDDVNWRPSKDVPRLCTIQPHTCARRSWLKARIDMSSNSSIRETGIPSIRIVVTTSAAVCKSSNVHDAAIVWDGIGSQASLWKRCGRLYPAEFSVRCSHRLLPLVSILHYGTCIIRGGCNCLRR